MSMEEKREKAKRIRLAQPHPMKSITERFMNTHEYELGYNFGKTPLEIIEKTRKNTCPASITFLRKSILHNMGLKRTKNAENLIITGCLTPFGMTHQLANYFKLMDQLGITYTFIRDTEYCCGAPAINFANGAEMGATDAGAKELVELNLAQCKKLGAKNMYYFCYWCAAIAQRHLNNSGVVQKYFPDIFIGKIENRKFKMKPTRAGYYEGCWLRPLEITPDLEIPLERYRSWMNNVEGLELVDLRHSTCCATAKGGLHLIEEAERKKVSCIITPCTGCFAYLERHRNRVPLRFITDVLAEAIQPE